MPGTLKSRFALTATLFFTGVTISAAPGACAQSPELVAKSARISSRVDTSQIAKLHGHVPVYANAAKLPSSEMSPAANFARLTLVLNRGEGVEAAFEQLLADQQNPASPRYHQWLQPAQVGELYGPSQSDVDAVAAWLQSRGLSIVDISPSRTLITFGGSASAVASAFSTNFRVFSLANGESRYSLVEEPSVPLALAPVIKTIAGLSQVIHHPTAKRGELVAPEAGVFNTPGYTSSRGGHYLVAGDFAIAYDMNPVYAAGYDGTGQKIAVVGEARVDSSDISNLQSLQGQTAKQPNVVIPPTGVDPGTPGDTSGKDNGYQDEATLDIDRTLGNAPGAQVDLVVSGDVNGGSTYATDGLYIAINYAINTLNDPILSVSFGGCEYLNGSSSTLYESSIFQTAAAQGISAFVSSGDDGAAACKAFDDSKDNYDTIRSVNDLCSPYVTCMGGTEFADSTNASSYWSPSNNTSNHTSILSYIPEGAWNDVSVTNGQYSEDGTGGGVSMYLPKPSYQSAAVFTGNFRWMPDMALTSSPHDGFVTCLNYLGADCLTTGFFSFGGTSAAAPSMAAIQAVTNQKLGGRQGNINQTLYTLGATPANGVFHDVTVASSGVSGCALTTPSLCNNSTSGTTTLTGGVQGYLVATGWDPATGWGSLDVSNYVGVSTGGSGGTTTSSLSLALSPALSAISFTSGATTSNTNTVNVTASGTFSGSVGVTPSCSISASSAYYQPSCSVTPGALTFAGNGAQSVTVAISSTPAVTVSQLQKLPSRLVGGSAVFALLIFCCPIGRRRSLRAIAVLLLFASGMAGLSGCGSGGSAPAVLGTSTIHSSAGVYTVTVTASGTPTGSSKATASTTFTVTIN